MWRTPSENSISSAISSVGRALPRHGRGHWFKSSIAHTGITEFHSEFPKETGPVVFFCGCSAAGSASPCQGEGREFESRHPLWFPLCGYPCEAVSPRWNGRVVRQRSAKPCTRVRFPFPPLVTMMTFVIVSAISSVGRALPRHGRGHWFKSSIAHTGITEFHSEFPKETGPVVFFCGCSAAGSASPCQGEGREFESRHPLQFLFGKRRLSVGRGGVRAREAYSQRSGEYGLNP